MEESEVGVDGSDDGRGEDGEKEEKDKNEKNNTLMLLELLTIAILFQRLISQDDLPLQASFSQLRERPKFLRHLKAVTIQSMPKRGWMKS